MAEALHDLEQVLMSKKEKLTPQEANTLLSCQIKSIRDLTAGSLAGGIAAFAATWKLSKPFRINISAGVGALFGLWIMGRSMNSAVDQILTLQGSVLQKELANIVVTKYHSDPSLMKIISKHFYSERIFDDSTSGTPKLRWRYRNFFSEDGVHGYREHDSHSHDRTQGESHNDSQGDSKNVNVNDKNRPNPGAKHTSTKTGHDVMTEPDPLDCLFDNSVPLEEIHHPNTPSKPSGTHNPRHRRSHRRRRMRNHEDLSNSEHAAAV